MLKDLGWIHALFIHVLTISADKRPAEYLAVFASCPEEKALDCLEELQSRGLAAHCAHTGKWQGTVSGASAAPECCRMLREQCEPGSVPYSLGWLEEALWPAVIDAFLRMIDERLKNKDVCAAHCLELLILFFLDKGVAPAQNDAAKNNKLMESILFIQILSVSSSTHVELAATLFQVSYEAGGFLLGEEFSPYIDLTKNIVDFSFAKGIFSADVLDAHEKFLHDPGAGGDFPALLHSLRLAEHGQRLEKQAHSPTQVEMHFLNSMAFCISQTAMHMRRFSLANDIIRSVGSIAALSGKADIADLWLAHAAFVQLRQGEFDAALEALDYLTHCAQGKRSPAVAASAARGLAIYHYLHNRIDAAYRTLSQETVRLIKKDIAHSAFLDPLNFDMLYALERGGYPPIPRYHLDEVIDEALRSPSQLMQGAALRTKAIRLRARGASPHTVIAMLHESAAKFHPERDFRDLALTLHELANTLTFIGEYEQADMFRLQVADIVGYKLTANTPYRVAVLLATLAKTDLPGVREYERPSAPASAGVPPEDTEESLRLLRSCHKELQQLSVGLSFTASLQHMVEVLRHTLECLTAALFQPLPTGGYSCIAMRGDKASEALQEQMADCAAWINEQSFVSHEGVIRRTDTELCFCLEVGNPAPWVLYLQFADASAMLLRSVPMVLQMVATSLTTEVRTVLRLHQLHEEKMHLQRQFHGVLMPGEKELDEVMGASMNALLHDLEGVGSSDAPVLILGETGVGKEVVAKYLHKMSGRTGPFVAVHPASTTETLFESEFFGHERGAFTGASSQRSGYFENADKGTLFIDEVGDIPIAMQTKLLRVLQDQTFMRVGSSKVMRSNFRLITATNKDLAKGVREGLFREDFFYRIAVALCTIPPLRERKDDISPLVEAFAAFFARRYKRPRLVLTEKQLGMLVEYPWPGNVRELKSAIERMTIGGGFSEHILSHNPLLQKVLVDEEALWASCTRDFPSLEEVERRYLHSVLQRAEGRIRGEDGVAALLGMKESTLYAKLKRHGLSG